MNRRQKGTVLGVLVVVATGIGSVWNLREQHDWRVPGAGITGQVAQGAGSAWAAASPGGEASGDDGSGFSADTPSNDTQNGDIQSSDIQSMPGNENDQGGDVQGSGDLSYGDVGSGPSPATAPSDDSSAAIVQGYDSQQRSQDLSAQDFSNMLLDQATEQDPTTGATYQVDATSSTYALNQDGTITGSDPGQAVDPSATQLNEVSAASPPVVPADSSAGEP